MSLTMILTAMPHAAKIAFFAAVFDTGKKKFAGIPIKGQSNSFLFRYSTPITIQGFYGHATNLQKRILLSERFRNCCSELA